MNKRFPWGRAPKLACCLELQLRDIQRKLNHDSDLICLVCGVKPKKTELCYNPATGPSTTTNQIIGHVHCVDVHIDKNQAGKTPQWFEAKKFVDKFHDRVVVEEKEPVAIVTQPRKQLDVTRYADGAALKRKLEQVVSNPVKLPATSLEQARFDADRIKSMIKEKFDKGEYDKGFAAGYSAAYNEISELLGLEK